MKGGGVHLRVGKETSCPNCGSGKMAKRIFKTDWGDRIKGNYCNNCGHGKPAGVLI